MEIRTFQKNDLSSVIELVKKMADYHHSLDASYKPAGAYQNWDEIVGGWLDDPETQVFVAIEADQVVGYIRVGVETAPEYSSEKRIGIVFDSFVEDKYRRQGIAGRLFETAAFWLKKKKVSSIELNVDFRNESATALWRKLGFQEIKIRMRRSI